MSIAIKAENVSKAYRLGTIGSGSLAGDLERWISRLRGKEDPFSTIGKTGNGKGRRDTVWSLKNVSFEIEQGTAVGIIGANGAGKSTLLKILSRVTTPTTGTVTGQGRVASLLEVGTGFHPELTGRENIYLNGAILGMRKKEISRKFDEMVDFAGVDRYIDTPVKRYSSGMYVRLAFAVAAYLESEILILDEVLAVGDAEFQKKCFGKIGDVSAHEGRTVLFVSHDLNAVSHLCKDGLFLRKGKIESAGRMSEIMSAYLSQHKQSPVFETEPKPAKPVYIQRVQVRNGANQVGGYFSVKDPVYLDFKIGILNFKDRFNLFVLVLDAKKRRVFACESSYVKENMTLTIRSHTLVRGNYSITALIYTPQVDAIDWVEDVCHFRIFDTDSYLAKHGEYDYGVVFGNHEWT